VTAFSLSPSGEQAVTITSDISKNLFVTTATAWDLSTLKGRLLDRVEAELGESGQVTGSNAQINSVRFGDSGGHVVISRQGKGGRSGRVSIVQMEDMTTRTFDLPLRIGAPQTGFLSGRNQLITLNGEAAFRWSVDGMVHVKSYRPQAAVNGACFTSDGKIAATASRSVRLWTTDTGEAIGKLENPHQGEITSLDVANGLDSSGYLFVTTGDDASPARLWSWKDRKSGFRLEKELGIEGTTVMLARFLPDGDRIMLSGANGSIQIQSLSDPSSTFEWDLPEGLSATCCSFSSDGHYLAVGASDKSAWLIDLRPESTTKPRVMKGHADRIESICVLQDGTDQIRVLTASRDKSARVWDPRLSVSSVDPSQESDVIEGREVLAFRRHSQGVTAVDCTSDGSLVVTAGRDGRVLLWPAQSP
jgi:WD40 repeat protein